MSPYALIAVAYLLGAIPFGLLIVKAGGGGDIRATGSGNIGAANVARNAGAMAGALTLLLDAGKGYLAVWLTSRETGGNIGWIMTAAVAAVLGHVFPIWLKFRGGKGVATGLGVMLPICWQAVAASAVVWLLVVAFWRYSSLGSISAAAAMPVLVYLFYAPPHAPPTAVNVGVILIVALIIAKHGQNIRRLIDGTEARLGLKR
jgi:acyl phosphate:glycerol-3-phosphate acyltransferase